MQAGKKPRRARWSPNHFGNRRHDHATLCLESRRKKNGMKAHPSRKIVLLLVRSDEIVEAEIHYRHK
jgi:hypothetical protein